MKNLKYSFLVLFSFFSSFANSQATPINDYDIHISCYRQSEENDSSGYQEAIIINENNDLVFREWKKNLSWDQDSEHLEIKYHYDENQSNDLMQFYNNPKPSGDEWMDVMIIPTSHKGKFNVERKLNGGVYGADYWCQSRSIY